MYVVGGWVPVVSEDGNVPAHESEWMCSDSLACLNLGECNLVFLHPSGVPHTPHTSHTPHSDTSRTSTHLTLFTNPIPTLHSSDTMMWEKCPDFAPNEQGAPLSCPTPRAGACAAVVGTRMYLWSGRDGYKKIWNQQVSVGDA